MNLVVTCSPYLAKKSVLKFPVTASACIDKFSGELLCDLILSMALTQTLVRGNFYLVLHKKAILYYHGHKFTKVKYCCIKINCKRKTGAG